METIGVIKDSLPYIRKFRNKVFVVKLGGEIVQEEEALDSLAEDVSLLHNIGIEMVLVHGGGQQADDMLKRLGIAPTVVNGRRVTDDQTLEVVKMVFGGKINTDLLAALREHGGRAVGLSGVDGNLIHAERRPARPVTNQATGQTATIDFGHVGNILKVEPELLSLLLKNDFIPVICSLAGDDEGHIYNLNADTVAAHVAAALGAEKLIVLTNVSGILKKQDDPTSLISYAGVPELTQLMQAGVIRGGMGPKVEACMWAVEHGVPRSHIINGAKEHALLEEVFTNAGSGTMIVSRMEPSGDRSAGNAR